MMKVKATVWKTTVIRAGSKLPQVWQEQQHPKSPQAMLSGFISCQLQPL